MPEEMKSLELVWDTGDVQDPDCFDRKDWLDFIGHFKARTGASRVVELRWVCQGRLVSCPYPATVLPDRSGVVLMDEWHFQGQSMELPAPYPRHLRVLNPDGSLRLRIFPPRIDEHSRPEESWIEVPREFAERGVSFGCPASDGHYDMVVEYDWQTGQVLRWVNAAPWLRY